MASGRSVFHVARECAKITAGGGVGDVVLELALKCRREGIESSVILPRYGKMKLEPIRLRDPYAVDIPMRYTARADRYERVEISLNAFDVGGQRLEVWLVDADRFRGKSHPYTYQREEEAAFHKLAPGANIFCGAEKPPFREGEKIEGVGHFDYFAMNTLFQKAGLEILRRHGAGGVAHCHDAHAAALPLLAKNAGLANWRFVTTAHNCGDVYRQRCADQPYVAAVLGAPLTQVQRCTVDGAFDPFAAALHGDALNTVSEGYAWEVEMAHRTSAAGDEDLRGFSSFLAREGKRLVGITNGIDPSLKGPEALAVSIRPSNMGSRFEWKAGFKRAFLQRVAIPSEQWPGVGAPIGSLARFSPEDCLFTFVGRLTSQKAPDVLIRATEEVFDADRSAGLCVLGDSDEAAIREKLRGLAARYPGRVVIFTGFSEALSSEIYAAGDFFLIPSRFEPCGLIDYIAQLNGNIPIANQVGGLSKIIDGVTGLGYLALDDRHNLRGLVSAMRAALVLFLDSARLAEMRVAANAHVRANHTWEMVFPRYLSLYGLEPTSISEAQA
jgi:starch synthase